MKAAKKIICLLLSLCMLLPLAACSDNTVVVAKYKNTTVDSGMLSYMLSSQKAYLEQMMYYYYGTTDFDTVWKLEVGKDESGNPISYADSAFEGVVNALKMFVVVKQLCSELNLAITDQSTIDAIEGYISEDVATAGDVNFLEIALAEYGATISHERDYLYTTSLTSVLLEHFYGENGTRKIAESEIRKAFDENYTKVEMNMFSYTEKDSSGSYVDRSDSTLTDEQLKQFFDENYVKAEHILFYFYDTADTTGKTKISDAEQQQKRDKASALFEQIKNGETDFDTAKKSNNEDPGVFTGADGDVIGKGQLNEKFAEFEKTIFGMEVGEIVMLETDIGVHIVRRNAASDSDFEGKKTEVRAALTRSMIEAEAREFYDGVVAGSVALDAKTTYGSYEKPFTFAKGELGEEPEKLISELKPGETLIYSDTSCTVVFRKLATTDEDYNANKATLESQLSQDAFYDYIESLYPQVELNEEEIAKYTFEAVKSLNISSYS